MEPFQAYDMAHGILCRAGIVSCLCPTDGLRTEVIKLTLLAGSDLDTYQTLRVEVFSRNPHTPYGHHLIRSTGLNPNNG